jgi:hypothetical protein
VCSQCASDGDCGQGAICGVTASEFGLHRACVQPRSREVGAYCDADGQCASGHCLRGLPFNNATCAQCTADDDCADGETCGVEPLADGVTRVCEPVELGALGELCAGNNQCASGVCCFGACSECCGEWVPCEDGAECGSSQSGRSLRTLLCAPGASDRERGEPCGTDLDCRSGRCELPPNVCLLPGDEDSPDFFEAVCRVDRQLAGVCR